MPTIEDAIRAALPLLADGVADDDVVRQLAAKGVDAPVAEQVIAFVPLAFGRVFLHGLGITFADEYMIPKDGTQVRKPLKTHPVFRAAMTAAMKAQREEGVQFANVALRSSECSAVNNALNAGSSPENLVCGPPALLRLDDATDDATPPRRRWWPFR